MSETAPENPFLLTAKDAITPAVWMKADANPTEADERTDVKVIGCSSGIGTNGLPTCEMVVDLGETGERLKDIGTPEGWHTFVEVWQPDSEGYMTDEDGVNTSTLLHWGELSIQNLSLAPGVEGQKYVSRVEPRHFGDVLLGPKVVDANLQERQQHTEVIFNVEYDKKVLYNRSTYQNKDTDDRHFFYFIDPFSASNGYAVSANGEQGTEVWTLAEAIKYLCYTMNDEAYIDSPSEAHIDSVFDVAAELRNFHVRRGEFLCTVLDQICGAYGFSWFLAPTSKANSTNRLQISFFRFGAGDTTQIFLQKPGEDLDLSKTSCLQADMTYNVADIANRVIVQGGFIERECTFELKRGWPESDDAYSADELDISDKASIFSTSLSKRDVWRKWVLNEGGGYTGLRSTVAPITTAFDLTGILGTATVIKQRRFHDCLARDKDGLRIDPVVEWYNPTPSDNGAAAWEKVTWSYHLSHHECAIYFSDNQPPGDLIAAGNDARIRITATIRGDTRVQGISDRRPDSPNGEDVTLFLDNHDWFADRRIQKTGSYASQLALSVWGSDERDDTNAIQAFADKVRNQEDAIRLSATFTIHGINGVYRMGQMIDKIDGRNISLNRMSKSREEKRYLQITEISFDTQGQTTSLRVDSLELKKRDLDTGTI